MALSTGDSSVSKTVDGNVGGALACGVSSNLGRHLNHVYV